MEGLQEKIREVGKHIDAASETRSVYQHMVARLRRELHIVQQKVTIMEGHLRRKTHEVEKRQDASRRVHQDKVACINRLEEMEQEMDLERQVCSMALNDLDDQVRQKRAEVNHREEFERWRYEIALDAANEAFQATAGRYRKIYAVEKLTSNCLQKRTFEQAEQSQATEDGFQKIREVTGLTDVMDIVHKFLNRETEHEQLRIAVREAEVKLHSLREAEAARHSDGAVLELQDDNTGLELSRRLLMESIYQWGKKMSRSLAAVEELPPMEMAPDVLPYFDELEKVVDRFLTKAQEDVPAPKLSKLAGQASTKEYTEQMKLLTDKDFIRLNIRVPASLDPRGALEDQKRSRAGGQNANDDERQELEHTSERDRIKFESLAKVGERMPPARVGDGEGTRAGRRERAHMGDDGQGGHAEEEPAQRRQST
eukprot:CAMPEP_0115564336 /NCGR_PEP_ID=MMETSP0271-20121206/102502_1 /TAXON_ID=71861 /ORGANISM="Scrippsiella trochoidea, Strain CCMP3099" /LENGTH=425 /DNA_ID=CAMNT_0002998581 /DNA_START=33 /DNA_END=1308 /DNA_ORIENTATION=-